MTSSLSWRSEVGEENGASRDAGASRSERAVLTQHMVPVRKHRARQRELASRREAPRLPARYADNLRAERALVNCRAKRAQRARSRGAQRSEHRSPEREERK